MKSWISHCSDLGELFHHCISEKPSQILPSSECWLPLKHFEVNHSWQFYYKYVALVIVAWKVMEKICKDIKLDFSSAENGKKKNVSLKTNILGDVYIKSKKSNLIYYLLWELLFLIWKKKKEIHECIHSTLHTWWQPTTYRFLSKNFTLWGPSCLQGSGCCCFIISYRNVQIPL